MKQIIPHNQITDSAESFRNVVNKRSSSIYISVLCFVLALFVLSFFIHINISIRASGIIKPFGEHVILSAPNSGYIKLINASENLTVIKGDTLFTVNSDKINLDLTRLRERAEELKLWISDLELITNADDVEQCCPQTILYERELELYLSERFNLRTKSETLLAEFSRYEILHQKGLVAESEYEKIRSQYISAESEVKITDNKYNTSWIERLQENKEELRRIKSQLVEINVNQYESVVLAPKDGVVQRIENIVDETYVYNGQKVLELSPHGELIAECYVLPKDIGYLHLGQQTLIKVAAFNYNDWGMLKGDVYEISDDVWTTSDQNLSYYKVYIHLDKDYLTLKSGRIGSIKKGMNITCNFVVTRRTVFQLIYDKVDDWLNPNLLS